MASSYTDIGTELMTTGENAGNWGTKTNTNLQILEEALRGYVSQSIAGGVQTTALTYTDGTVGDAARNMVIALTGTITGNQTVTVTANEKLWIIDNQTSGAYTVNIKVSGQTGVTWAATDKGTKILYCNGTDVIDTGISSTGAFDLDGNEFILDADADTSITADTDDQIDIKIAGADDFQFTANTFTAQSGSTIAAQALTATTVTASGIIKTDDTTAATSTTDGSLQTDGGLSVAADAVIGDDLKLLSDSAVLSFGADSDTTLTHTDGTGLTLNGANKLLFRDTGLTIGSNADGDLDIVSDGTAVDSINVESGGGITLDAGTAGSGIIYEDDGTEMARIHNSSSNVILETKVSDADFSIKGNDGGSTITPLTFDMSDAGKATFSGNVIVSGDLTVSGDDITMGTNTAGNLLVADGTNFNSIAAGDLSSISTIANDDVFIAVDTSGGGLKKVARSVVVAGLATSGAITDIVEDTSPQLGGDLDTNSANILIDDAHFIADENGNEQIIFQTTSSAVNQFDVTNAATGNPPSIKATGGDSNIDFDISAKGTGHVTVLGGTNSGAIQFNCESNSHGQIIKAQPHSAGVTNEMLLPDGSSSTLVSLVATQTLTNKTLTTPVIAEIDSGADITLDATADVVIDAAGGNVEFKDAGTLQLSLDMDGTAGVQIIKLGVDSDDLVFQQYDGNEVMRINDDRKLYFFDDGGESIASDGTDFTFTSGAKINLTATSDVHIPANVGVVFGTGEKIEGDSTDLTVTSGAKINLTATSDIHIPNDVGIVFGGDSEKIEGDGTDLVISANNLTVDAAADIILDAGGNDWSFKAGGTEVLKITNSSSDVIIKPIVDAKDIIFQQRDGTEVARIEDNATFNVSSAGKFAYAGTAVTATAAELNYSDLATLGTSAASKVLSADANNLSKITGAIYIEEATLSFDATQDWDVRASPVAQVTLTNNVTFDAPTNPTTGQYISVVCIQDGTGSRTIAWNAVFEFTGGTAPTATTTAGKADLFTFRYHNSHWIEVGRNLNLTRA
jgi:hypothetical protein